MKNAFIINDSVQGSQESIKQQQLLVEQGKVQIKQSSLPKEAILAVNQKHTRDD